jgi:hypothetical protein
MEAREMPRLPEDVEAEQRYLSELKAERREKILSRANAAAGLLESVPEPLPEPSVAEPVIPFAVIHPVAQEAAARRAAPPGARAGRPAGSDFPPTHLLTAPLSGRPG